MRVGFRRLVYLLIGAALAVGLLVSVLVRPEPRLAASENCYGLCPSVTVLSLSNSTVIYGFERVEKFSVDVSASSPGTGMPTGFVVVESGTKIPKILCGVYLNRGKGSCSPSARALRRGSHEIVAWYSGGNGFKSSMSKMMTLIVVKNSGTRKSSMTNLSIAGPRFWLASTAIYGKEQAKKFTVKVNAGTSGTRVPSGSVAVEAGTKLLCRIHLSRGRGSCSPTAKALPRGSYGIAAHYSGDTYFKPSMSSTETLIVLK